MGGGGDTGPHGCSLDPGDLAGSVYMGVSCVPKEEPGKTAVPRESQAGIDLTVPRESRTGIDLTDSGDGSQGVDSMTVASTSPRGLPLALMRTAVLSLLPARTRTHTLLPSYSPHSRVLSTLFQSPDPIFLSSFFRAEHCMVRVALASL